MYDPILGRFIERDRAGFAAGDNLYRYGNDAPINRIDPIGHADAPEFPPTRRLGRAEMQEQAAKMLNRGRDAHHRVTKLLQEARQCKDIIRMNCVNEKLKQITGLIRVSEDSHRRMREAIARGSEGTADDEFVTITSAHERILILRAEAEQCVGAPVFAGETEVVPVPEEPKPPDSSPSKQ